ncbi:MAG: threonine synthase [Endozoicomonas sp. (ex Botrylloides leachii)]|nr:threonine synthase [Endozoicomonas sp. (ex Botrylloides leachii)]
MKYISTRGKKSNKKSFKEVLLEGLADEGGLFVPESLPQFSTAELQSMRQVPYNRLAYTLIKPFVADDIADNTLKKLIDESYAQFSHPAVAPLYQLESNQWILELFHGPTLAFKDFALQLLGRLLDVVLADQGEQAVVLGATSGDTGSAAIEGCRHSKNLAIFILHPHQRVSDVQRRQMTTVLSPNVHNIAIKGDFDDCQALVKACFLNPMFLSDKIRLVAVNSINWARIMAQVVYYFYAGLRLGALEREIIFSVPTGNFGDVYAGYIAKKMGLPVHQFIVATNKNDILHRFFQSNDYSRAILHQTLSPSMDIMVSSNFERLLFNAHNQDARTVKQLMVTFEATGKLSVKEEVWKSLKFVFGSYASTDEDICQIIKETYKQTGYLLDPHTAAGVNAANKVNQQQAYSNIILATAHPAKFTDAINQARLNTAQTPTHITELFDKEERLTVLPKGLEPLQTFIQTHYDRSC